MIDKVDCDKRYSIDISSLPDQNVEIFVGVEPKVKCKNKFLQNILVKMFGYKEIYKTITAKVIETKAEDYPLKELNGSLTIEIGE